MHNQVLDVAGGSSMPGAKVIVWPKKHGIDRQNQLWYFDANGIVRSALNDFALTAERQLKKLSFQFSRITSYAPVFFDS